MPTYEYECLNCGHRFEIFQSMSAEPIKTCPKCYSSVRRLIHTGGGIIFKGPGFYATDYRKARPLETAEGKKGQSRKETQENKTEGKKANQKEESKTEDIKSR